MIQEDYVTFEQSKALKELGFPQEEYRYKSLWFDKYKDSYYYNPQLNSPNSPSYIRPILSLVQKWLREEKNIHIEIECRTTVNNCLELINIYYQCDILVFNFNDKKCHTIHIDAHYNSYEQALSAGIDKCIELLKNATKV